MEYYSATKRNGIIKTGGRKGSGTYAHTAVWMSLGNVMLGEGSQVWGPQIVPFHLHIYT